MLTALKMPYVAERFIGVTIPDGAVMYACSYEGLHRLSLEDSVRVETDREKSEDYAFLKSKGDALGVFGGAPILGNSKTKISYTFNASAEKQSIRIEHVGNIEAISFATLSGDWFFVSLSQCGKYLLLAEPYAIDVYKIA